MFETGPTDPVAEAFEAQRDRLCAVAYRMLGSHADAEDVVQEAWLRLSRQDAASIENLAAWLFVNKMVEREGGFTYFQGVLVGALATFAFASVVGILSANYWPHVVTTAGLVGALVFGSLGAVTSVFQRISADGVALSFTPSRLRLIALGSLRPMVGSTFGAVAHLGLIAGLLGSAAASVSATSAFGVSAVTGFAAGFSERLATDVVRRAEAMGTVSTGHQSEVGAS